MSESAARAETGRESLAELFTGSSNFVDRLPMLRLALQRCASLCSEYLAAASEKPPLMTLEAIESGIAADLLGAHDGKSAIGVLHAAKWNTRLLACVDRGAVFAIVEAMLGGDGSQPAYDTDRPLSRIEVRVAGAFIERVAKALEAAFTGSADTAFAVEGIAEEIDYDILERRNNSIVVARFRLEGGGAGEVLIAIARAALNPLRQALGRLPAKEAPTPDARWSQQIQSEVTRAHVMVTAILDERMGMLGEVAGFEVGQVVELNATAHGRVRLECNGERLMWCHLGKSNGKYTLRVDELVDREQEFLDEILAG